MPIHAVLNQDIRTKVKHMLAYQRQGPILVRIVTPKIRNVALSDRNRDYFVDVIKKLIEYAEAQVTLIINPNWMVKKEDRELLENFEKMGVKIHANSNLHAKFILVETPSEKLLLAGSANMTKGGFIKNDEGSIAIFRECDKIYDDFFDYVTRMLKRANEFISGGDFTPRREEIIKSKTKLERKIKELDKELKYLEGGI
ncbi:MAG: hypothetical protein IIC67_06725 [Thaumarchaeota archaeon]|nr:hypothetical protein [Nitrososphaerota archaeon]